VESLGEEKNETTTDVTWWNLFSFWQLFGCSLKVNIFTTSVWVRHLSPHWTCRRVEEISDPPGWGICLCVFFASGLTNFRIGRDWVTIERMRTRMCLAVQCDPESSTWAGMPRNVYRKPPGRDRNVTPSSVSPGAGPCVSACLCQCSLAGAGELHRGPALVTLSLRGVNIMMHQPHPAVDWMVSPRLSSLSPTSQILHVSLLATVPA